MRHFTFNFNSFTIDEIFEMPVSDKTLHNYSVMRQLIHKANKQGPLIKTNNNRKRIGLFAEKDYKKYDFVTIYGGKVNRISDDFLNQKEITSYSVGIGPNTVLNGYSGFNIKKEKGRWINSEHIEQNVMFDYDSVNKTYILHTVKKVKKGEEFSLGYVLSDKRNMNYFDENEEMIEESDSEEIDRCIECKEKTNTLCSECDDLYCKDCFKDHFLIKH